MRVVVVVWVSVHRWIRPRPRSHVSIRLFLVPSMAIDVLLGIQREALGELGRFEIRLAEKEGADLDDVDVRLLQAHCRPCITRIVSHMQQSLLQSPQPVSIRAVTTRHRRAGGKTTGLIATAMVHEQQQLAERIVEGITTSLLEQAVSMR